MLSLSQNVLKEGVLSYGYTIEYKYLTDWLHDIYIPVYSFGLLVKDDSIRIAIGLQCGPHS